MNVEYFRYTANLRGDYQQIENGTYDSSDYAPRDLQRTARSDGAARRRTALSLRTLAQCERFRFSARSE
jgi:hypothetical protein